MSPPRAIFHFILAGSHLTSYSSGDSVCSAGTDGEDATCLTNPRSKDGSDNSVKCEDRHTSCQQWSSKGKCEKDGVQMYKKCPASCGACLASCIDTNDECSKWAALGECDANPAYMLVECKRSCHYCRKGLKAPVVTASIDTESGDCHDGHAKCEEWSDKGECTANPKYMLTNCPVQCGVCQSGDPHPSFLPECQDRHPDCFKRAQEGQCLTNTSIMLEDCQRSCRVCGKDDPCRPNISDVGVLHRAGVLNEIFEHVIATENVTVLSRDPYVMLIHNVVPLELIDDVHKVFGDTWDRSRVGGVPGADTTGGIRTSEQQWCREECEKKPDMAKVTLRIEKMLGIRRTRFEDLQILRYLPGQEYKEHHDYIDEQIYFPCGPRIFTLFLYLNDVHEGGETVFPLLNLSISPRKGMALLWPHVLNDDPLKFDRRTQHFGLPPRLNNTKYAMNFWIHQFDFRRYNLIQCLTARRPRSSYHARPDVYVRKMQQLRSHFNAQLH